MSKQIDVNSVVSIPREAAANEYLVAFRDMPEWQRWTEDR